MKNIMGFTDNILLMYMASPNYSIAEGTYKRVFILNPPTNFAYMTSKVKTPLAYKAARDEKIYTHSLHVISPTIVANALNIDETNRENLSKLPILPDEFVFKKPLVQPVDNRRESRLYREMCEIIDILALHGLCFLDMKPANVGRLHGRLVIIDADIKYLYYVTPELMEYFKQSGKLIALFNTMRVNLTPAELQEQFSLGPDFLLATDLSLAQKEEIIQMNRVYIPEGHHLEFPKFCISFYGEKAFLDIKKANPREFFPYSEYEYSINVPLERVGLQLDLDTYLWEMKKQETHTKEEEAKRKQEYAKYKEFVLSKSRSLQNSTRNTHNNSRSLQNSTRNTRNNSRSLQNSTRNTSNSRNSRNSRNTHNNVANSNIHNRHRPNSSMSRYPPRPMSFFRGINTLQRIGRTVAGPAINQYTGFHF